MEWQSFLLLVFFKKALIECKVYNSSISYVSEVFKVEYSDISIENGAYGRVYVSDHDYNTKAELCAFGFKRREAEALCRIHGYSLKYFLKVSPSNNSDFVVIHCFEYLNNFHKCEARRLGYCENVVELHCYYEPFQTTTQRQFTVVTGHPDVSLLYGTQGPVFVRSNEHGYNLYVVCCTEFTLTDGEALCQSLGYSFYRFNCRLLGNFQIKTVDANCHSHNIQSCDFRSNGYCSRLVDLLCIDNTTAAVQNATVNTNKTTAAVQIATDNTRVRLVGSSHMDRGTVEVLHNGRWGTICDDGFDKVDGDVICRMLGFDSAREVYHDFLMGPDRRPIWLVDVDCQGYESDISQCKSKGWGITYCGHLEDASVRCKNRISAFGNTSIRLVGSQYPDRGNIEVSDYWYGSWGTICGEFFNETTADDICRMLGYNFSRKIYSNAYFGPSEGTSLQCTVSENDIQCRSLWSDFKYCHRNDVVGIHCGYTDVRLVGSGHSDRGTIEVLHNGQWGTICDHNFDKEDGDVICRMLGFNSSSNVYSAAHFGQGYGPIWLNGVRCNGYETDVAECGSQGWGIHDCNHGEDAGVYCVNNASDYHGPSTDPCDSNICYNGGTCIPTYSGYKGYYCQCAYGFSGSNCENYYHYYFIIFLALITLFFVFMFSYVYGIIHTF